jgi:MFS family permease
VGEGGSDEGEDDGKTTTTTTTTMTRRNPVDWHVYLYSVSYFISDFVFGNSFSSLGPAIATGMTTHFNRSETDFAVIFTIRGVGFIFGTLIAAGILESRWSKHLPKQILQAFFVAMIGATSFGVMATKNFLFAQILFAAQGVAFGAIDIIVNLAFVEMWKKSVGPWMQMLCACFSVGAVTGPMLVGAIGWERAYLTMAMMAVAPIIILLIGVGIDQVIRIDRRLRHQRTYKQFGAEAAAALEMAELRKREEAVAAEALENASILAKRRVPLSLKSLLTCACFIYLGCVAGFGGWISTYAKDKSITESDNQLSLLASAFWAAITLGRFANIFIVAKVRVPIVLSVTLSIALIGASSIMISVDAEAGYNLVCACVFILGLGISPLYPLNMTLLTYYDFFLDGRTTATLVLGCTLGEATIPVLMGYGMALIGPDALPASVIITLVSLVITYISFHFVAMSQPPGQPPAPPPTTT